MHPLPQLRGASSLLKCGRWRALCFASLRLAFALLGVSVRATKSAWGHRVGWLVGRSFCRWFAFYFQGKERAIDTTSHSAGASWLRAAAVDLLILRQGRNASSADLLFLWYYTPTVV